jgi:hypothetical protein
MDIQLAINHVNSWFQYRADRKDEHLFLSPEQPFGDCEDYALTVLLAICDGDKKRLVKQLKRGDSALVFCVDPYQQRHNVLRYGTLRCDNQLREWVTHERLVQLGYTKIKEVDYQKVIRRIKQGRKPNFLQVLLSWLPLPL